MRIVMVACLLGFLPCALAAEPGLRLHVSPAGSDSGDGRPPATGFATLERARDEIRRLKASGPLPSGGVAVELTAGVHLRRDTFQLSAEDSGTAASPIVYRSASREQPARLLGGRTVALADFRRPTNPAVLGRLDPGATPHIVALAQASAVLASVPEFPAVFDAGMQNGIGYKYISNPDDSRPGNGKEPWYALNLIEEIDRPGEWAVDFTTGVLFFWPPEGARELTITQLAEPLITATGVAHVDLVGLDLGYSLGHGLVAENVEFLRLLGSRIYQIAGTAVVLNGRRSVIQSNDLHDLGAGGVLVGGGDSRRLESSENRILNNHIHHYGVRRAQYSAGVDVGFGGASNHRGRRDAVGVLVAYNRIHDTPRDAILVNGQDHVFEFNEVTAYGFGSADTGSFYSWLDWTIRGVVIRYNFLYDTVGSVNPDDGASGVHVYGNVFAGPRTGVWIASGPDHVVENNIFVKDEGPVFGLDDRGDSRGYATNKHLHKRVADMAMDSPPWSERFPGLAARLADRPELPRGTPFERNLIVIPKGDPIKIGLSKRNRDKPELLHAADNWTTPANPGFVDAAAGNFALQPGADAFRRISGFKPIPFGQIGLRVDEYRATVSPRPVFKGTPPPARQPDQERNFGT
jgi:hypothetical protein